MKKLILLLSLVFLSCGKSMYYAYEITDKNYSSYCTLEITSKKEIIYRGSSYKYLSDSYPYSNEYIYIHLYGDQSATDINDWRNSFVHGIADLWIIKKDLKPKLEQRLIDFVYKPDYSVLYKKTESDTIISVANNNFEYLKEGRGFETNGIKWFPPYMVKIDKIDYAKFGKSIQHLNLKNPRQ